MVLHVARTHGPFGHPGSIPGPGVYSYIFYNTNS